MWGGKESGAFFPFWIFFFDEMVSGGFVRMRGIHIYLRMGT